MPLDPDDERRMRRVEDALGAFLDAFDALLSVIIPLVKRAKLNDDDEVVEALAELSSPHTDERASASPVAGSAGAVFGRR